GKGPPTEAPSTEKRMRSPGAGPGGRTPYDRPVTRSPGRSPRAAAGIPTTGAGMGPGTGGTEGTRTSFGVAGMAGSVTDGGESVKDGLVARAPRHERTARVVRRQARLRRMARPP